MPDLHLHIATTLGLLLGVCLIAGVFADFLRLPKVTAYLMVGLLLGPSALDWVPADHVQVFEPLLELAMAVVLFNLGCEFTFAKVRRVAGRCLVLSGAEILTTFALVTCGLLIFGCSASVALLLGCLAVATAPATTILVLKEFQSEGPVTTITGFLVAMNNFACIVMFEFAFLAIQLVRGAPDEAILSQFGAVVLNIAGSVALGISGGLIVSYGCGLLNTKRWLVLLVAAATSLLGISESFSIPYMVTFLVMGVTVANTSENKALIVDELDHLSGLLAVLFFSVHGTHMDLHAIAAAGTLGFGYFVLRISGKWLGVYGAARATGQPLEVRQFAGSCLFAQAGAAIALSAIAVDRNPELGTPIENIILGTVVVFEIIGPLFIRQSLLQAGEVPLAHAIHHTSRTPIEQVRNLVDRFHAALRGRGPSSDASGELTVGHLIRQTQGIDQAADFDTVISHIEQSHDNIYPVVDSGMAVVGVISYPQLRDVMFDHNASQLVRAEDLISETTALLHPDQPVARAFELFQQVSDDCIPVVTRDRPQQLLGVVRRGDVMHALITQRRKQP